MVSVVTKSSSSIIKTLFFLPIDEPLLTNDDADFLESGESDVGTAGSARLLIGGVGAPGFLKYHQIRAM